MRPRLAVIAALLSAAAVASGRPQEPPRDFEVFTLRQPNGLVDVEAMDLPDAFVSRVADRSLRAQFRRRYRRVADVAEPPIAPVAAAPAPADAARLRVIAEPLAPEVIERWRAYLDDVPLLRGFRAPRLEHADDDWPIEPPLGRDAERHRRAGRFVSRHLARDGLVATTMRVVAEADLPWTIAGAIDETTFRAVGVPVDLLAFFFVDDAPIAGAIAAWIDAGAPESAIEELAGRAQFRFAPTRPGFAAAAEDGTAPISAFRLQISGPRFLRGPGEGSALDVLRQLATRASGERLCVSVHESKLDALLETMGAWTIRDPDRVTVVRAPAGLSDWAQDNGQPGVVSNGDDAPKVMTLVPRYASRNEQVSKLLVGDSLVFDTLTDAVGDAAISPLLFQGGNILRVVDPASGEGILLVGEAAIHRNRGLGLTAGEVAEAMAIEFGASRIIEVPATSFHADMEVTVRRVGDELVAFVVDDIAGARHIVAAGLAALARADIVDADTQTRLTSALGSGRTLPAMIEIRRRLAGLTDEQGSLAAGAVAAFRSQPFESAAANAGRFMLAVDVLIAASITQTPADPLTAEQQYILSLRDRLRERQALAGTLAARGLRVHPIPALGDDELGVNYVNVVHTTSSMLVPVMGGLFAPLDAAAMSAYRAILADGVELVPVQSAHAQTRFGGVHCLVAAYPD